MTTTYFTATSLDGYIADPDNSLTWLFQFPEPGEEYHEFASSVGALAMGSTTYQWMLDHVVGPQADHPQPWPWKEPVWVFTTRDLPVPSGVDVRFVRGDVRPVHEEMTAAAAGRNLWIVGGGDLAGQFHDAGLLDEIIVQIAPVTLGGGATLLPRRIATPPMKIRNLRLIGGAMAEIHLEIQRG